MQLLTCFKNLCCTLADIYVEKERTALQNLMKIQREKSDDNHAFLSLETTSEQILFAVFFADDRFARQNRYGNQPEFPLASSFGAQFTVP